MNVQSDCLENYSSGYTHEMPALPEMTAALRRYWGYDTFRPMQERIVTSLLHGRDTCVVMPTGGGKSLCYQLPAAISADGTVIVVSPLIALMQDQVAQLQAIGIPAALVNSSIDRAAQSRVIEQARQGAYRLLYLSPERLALAETLEWLKGVPLLFFAVDEAHCISEWGHEFRPDYRELSSLRSRFPDKAIAAFTASATRRVRHDIIEQLRLRDPQKFIASFHRPNLRYVVQESSGGKQQDILLRALRNCPEGNTIIYAPTISRVNQTVLFLKENGFEAVAYHGQMDNTDRRKNQEQWMSDEVRILVGTIAFGLGINKAAVRLVIHLSLPKSIEQYYQEAGRAGRDGLPADCLLLWQKRDAGLLAHFIGQIEDPREKEAAWQRYHEIRRFAEKCFCRHLGICLHFGETPKWTSCGACDVCGYTPASVSSDHVSGDHKVTPRRKPLRSPAPAPPKAKGNAPSNANATMQVPLDSTLRELLRNWRRELAKSKGFPAFVLMHDTTLDELCRRKPASLSELGKVPGFGQKKIATYGEELLRMLKQYDKDSTQPSLRPKQPIT